jgi:hypothetical protein
VTDSVKGLSLHFDFQKGNADWYLATGLRYTLKEESNTNSTEPLIPTTKFYLVLATEKIGPSFHTLSVDLNTHQVLPVITKSRYESSLFDTICGLELVVAFPFTLLMVVFFSEPFMVLS